MKIYFKTLTLIALSLVALNSCSSKEEGPEQPAPNSTQNEQVSMTTLKNRKWTMAVDDQTIVYNFLSESKVVVTEMSSDEPKSLPVHAGTRAAGPQTYEGTYTFNSAARTANVTYNGKTQKFENIVLTADANAPVPCHVDGKPVVMSAAIGGIEDKSFIESTAMQFVRLFNSKQTEKYASISKAVANSEVSSALDREMNSIIDGLTIKEEKGMDTYYTYAIKASLFQGQYILTNGEWTKKNAEGHSATFFDADGRLCQLVVTTSGQKKNVVVYESKRWYNTSTYNVEIPSHISVVLNQGESQVVKVVLDIDLNSVAEGQKIDLSKNSLSMTCVADFAGIAQITTVNSYKAQGESSSEIVVKQNGETIFTAAALASSNIMSQNPEDLGSSDVKTIKNVEFSMDILGKIQVKGTCSQVKGLVEALDKADRREDYESVLACVDEANKYFTANVYYNGGSGVRAWGKFDVSSEEYGYWIPQFDNSGNYIGSTTESYTEYKPAIAICFNDGTSYLMEDYFTAKAFKQVVDYVTTEAEAIERQF